ncbi:hypothetical protein ACR5MH_0605 (plasmid) [Streptomyces sp. L7]|uniref:hypothetical protein n=1 Tax=Streptomyces sp. L7 TaxID=3423954 RepID=UPI000E1FC2C5|nr:hypothetical protein DOE76_15010 [Leifsonia sp. ku-ls]
MSTENISDAARPRGLNRLWAWARSHRGSAIAVAAGAAVVIAAAAVGIPAAVGTAQHSDADAAYQAARIKAVTQYRQDVKAQKDFAAAVASAGELQKQLTQIHDQAKAGQYLPDAEVKTLAAQLAQLKMYAGFKAGAPVQDPHPAGKPTSTTEQLRQETARLTALVDRQAGAAGNTLKGGPGIASQVKTSNRALAQIVTGLDKSSDSAAIPALDVDAKGVITALAKAGQGQKDALTNAAAAAKKAVQEGENPAPLLLDFLAKAKAVHESHDATVAAEAAAAAQAAAEAAARAGQATYTDPRTGATHPTPGGGGRGGSGGGGSTGGGGSSGGGGGGGGGGSSGGGGGGGGGGYTPPAVDHTPHVVANGAYSPGCDGAKAYSQTTSSGGTIVINVGYPYSYSTFSTDDGWGLTVYACM